MGKNELFLGLSRLSFLSAREKTILGENLDNLESLTVLSIEDIRQIVGRGISVGRLESINLSETVPRDTEIMRRFGIRFVTVFSPEYPPLLREIHDPPFAIFWRGSLPDPERPLIGMVGTRSPTGTGMRVATRIAQEFGEAGVGVVSGLARGIDAFAHRGNASGGGRSVAVLACGLDRIYPRSNARLAATLIGTGGCLLSEYPPGTEPLKFRFPARNRIISGLSRAVLVVEAPERSGALITADFALEQGRDLLVCGETLASSKGAGIAALHADGAQAVFSAREVLSQWSGAKAFASRPRDAQLRFGFENSMRSM